MENIIFNAKVTCIFTAQAYAFWMLRSVEYMIPAYYDPVLIMRALGVVWFFVLFYVVGPCVYENDIRTYTYFLVYFCLVVLNEAGYISTSTGNWMRILGGGINTLISSQIKHVNTTPRQKSSHSAGRTEEAPSFGRSGEPR